MGTDLTIPAHDPSEIGFPPTLPLELAAKTSSVRSICESYGITKERWDELRDNPVFVRACEESIAAFAEPGGAFRAKARTIAEALLPRMYELAVSKDFDTVPAAVQADMIKAAVRIAGLDASIEQKAAATAKETSRAPPLQIQINLR